jgi:hypothetical protein
VADPLDALHAVSDTVVGPNLRLKDNAIQALAILLFAGAGAVVGWLLGPDDSPAAGILLGTIAGLVAGLLISGLALGIYRLATRVRGKA